MAAAAARKLQKEIEMTLKKVDDGVVEFEDLYDEASQPHAANKDRLGEDLKKSINKLQRFRVQIREWINMAEVKNKDKLEASRKKIEYNMQRFKDFERELKTKAYSTFALAKDASEDDLESQEKRESEEWLRKQLDALGEAVEMVEADIESIQNKKHVSARDKEEIEQKQQFKDRHQWHVSKLECLLRACDNDTLNLSELAVIKESVEFYIEAGMEPDYYHDETLYDNFDIAEYAAEQQGAQSKIAPAVDSEIAEKMVIGGSEKKAKAKKAAQAKKVTHNPAAQKNLGKTVETRKRVIADNGEQKIGEDQLVAEADEFICKICYVHVVGCSPKLTTCSHLFCGDCLMQWFGEHPELQTWAQRAKTAGDAVAHTVPCPVCKTPLNEHTDLHPICATATQSEHLLLWRMLSCLKVMCVNHSKVTPGQCCDWVGEYQHYQEHVKNCKNEPCMASLKKKGADETKTQAKDTKAAAKAGAAAKTSGKQAVADPTTKKKAGQQSRKPEPVVVSTPADIPSSTPAPAAPAVSSWGQGPPATSSWGQGPPASAIAASANNAKSAAASAAVNSSTSGGVRAGAAGGGASTTSNSTPTWDNNNAAPPSSAAAAPAANSNSTGGASGQGSSSGGAAGAASGPSATTEANASTSNNATSASPNNTSTSSSGPPASSAEPTATTTPAPAAPETTSENLQHGAHVRVLDQKSSHSQHITQASSSGGGSMPKHAQIRTVQQQQQNVTVNVTVNVSNGQATNTTATTTHQQRGQEVATSNAGEPSSEQAVEGAVHGVATSKFEPRGENTIEIQQGHQLLIIEEHVSGWTYVKNNSTGLSGWVPAWVVAKAPEPQYPQHMTALAPFEGNSQNELSIQKGEWLEVIERHETGWTFGKKAAGTEFEAEGWFPDWVIMTRVQG